MNDTETTHDTDEPTVIPHDPICIELSVPVEVELPPSVLDLCRWHYKEAQSDGRDPEFADYLCDLLRIEPTFVVDGDEIDPETGRPIEN